MKLLIALCFVAVVGISLAETETPSRGCVYLHGQCQYECEEGTHGYTTGCRYLTPEATCDNPKPVTDISGGNVCDFSACYCDFPTVRDTATGKCVPLDECPKKEVDKQEVETDDQYECEEGTHTYSPACGYLTPEATCKNPAPVTNVRGGNVCDFSACYCDFPTVRDTATGKCVPLEKCPGQSKCEEGTHIYSPACGYLTPEATCKNPKPRTNVRGGNVCDFSACYCDFPTVRNTATGKCVPLDECRKKEVEKKEEEKKEIENKKE